MGFKPPLWGFHGFASVFNQIEALKYCIGDVFGPSILRNMGQVVLESLRAACPLESLETGPFSSGGLDGQRVAGKWSGSELCGAHAMWIALGVAFRLELIVGSLIIIGVENLRPEGKGGTPSSND